MSRLVTPFTGGGSERPIPSSIPDQDAFNNRVIDWIEVLTEHGRDALWALSSEQMLELRDLLCLMNRERKNLRHGIEDVFCLAAEPSSANSPVITRDDLAYVLGWADSIDYRRH
jgi:hypothetical protein